MSGLIRVGVKVMPREVILDTQGRAVEHLLKQKQMHVSHCRVGRYVELDFATENQAAALEQAKVIAETVLHNPLIETYELIALNTGR
jgi:phosphoribosylformylglycinamidine synthase